MENVAVFTSLSKLLGVKLEIRVIYKVQQEIKVGVRKDQTFQIGFYLQSLYICILPSAHHKPKTSELFRKIVYGVTF